MNSVDFVIAMSCMLLRWALSSYRERLLLHCQTIQHCLYSDVRKGEATCGQKRTRGGIRIQVYFCGRPFWTTPMVIRVRSGFIDSKSVLVKEYVEGGIIGLLTRELQEHRSSSN